jgi:uncharacterized protein (DUF2132 family)
MTLEMILPRLVKQYGRERMGRSVNIRCFTNDPSIRPCLQFLKKPPWARKKVEELYLQCARETADRAK